MVARRETLVNVYRQSSDCIFKLLLTLDPDGGAKGISFTESYDYGPQAEDAGREYGYTAYSPFSAIAALTTFLEVHLDYIGQGGTAEDQLVSCFTELVARGKLGDGRALKFNYEQVLAWFEAAGVSAASDTWSWVNSV